MAPGVKCEWGPDALQHLDTASGMLDNSLQEVQTLFMRQLGKFRNRINMQVVLKDGALLGTPLRPLVQVGSVLL